MVVCRVLDSSWDEFETHEAALNFAHRWRKFHDSWVAIYDQAGLFCII